MSGGAARLQARWRRSVEVWRAPRVQIFLFGDDSVRAVYRAFTARHRLFKVTSAKRWGVALVQLPDSFEDYLGGSSMKYVRVRRRRAEKGGFRFATVAALDHVEEILEINRSTPTRQGRAMAASYIDVDKVMGAFRPGAVVHGILNSEGQLRAYAYVPVIGDAFVFSRILGHAEDLEQGIMFLLVSEVIRTFIESGRAAGESPAWAMYDTFWGASPGLAFFKEQLGFRPFTVNWVWRQPQLG